ncbi:MULTISPECIES: hypothetical protein [unclassified Streptomyces]|uniref:hypothetical protein n=1 Tax=unclassified Streptomyces TaxID=2593676 RepID=UPI002E2D34D5|nr:hypothetical protein [Streptomyces sp. NBC_01429]
MTDSSNFYAHDRPPHPTLPEDRPRGGGPKTPLAHSGRWTTLAIVLVVLLIVVVGIAMFP